MAEKIYQISSVKSVKGDPETLTGVIEGGGDVIDLSGTTATKLKDYLFSKSTCSEVILPETVTYIGYECFKLTDNLRKINLDNVKVLASNAFDTSEIVDIGNPKLQVVGKNAFHQAFDVDTSNFDTSELEIFSGNSNNYDEFGNLEYPKLEYLLESSFLNKNPNVPPTVINMGGSSSLWYNQNSGFQTINGSCFKSYPDPEEPSATCDWLVKTKTNIDLDLTTEGNVVGIATPGLYGTYNSIKFPEMLKHFSYEWVGNVTVSNNVYVPSLEWWLTRDFHNNRYALKRLIENKVTPYEAITGYALDSLRVLGHICDYDGNYLDQATEIELSEEAGVGCLGNFNKLEKLTVNLGEERQVNPNNGVALFNIGLFFGKSSGVQNTTSKSVQMAASGIYESDGNSLALRLSKSNNAGSSGESRYFPNTLDEVIINSRTVGNNFIPELPISKLTLNLEEFDNSISRSNVFPSNIGKTTGMELVINGTSNIGQYLMPRSSNRYIYTVDLRGCLFKEMPRYTVSSSYLRTIYLPNTIEIIRENAFNSMGSYDNIYYNGTIEEWNNIEIENGAFYNSSFRTVHCLDGDVSVR